MVQQNVETVEIMDDEELRQLDAETTQQPDDEMPETLEEQAQQVAIEQGYFDGSIPSDISAPSGLTSEFLKNPNADARAAYRPVQR